MQRSPSERSISDADGGSHPHLDDLGPSQRRGAGAGPPRTPAVATSSPLPPALPRRENPLEGQPPVLTSPPGIGGPRPSPPTSFDKDSRSDAASPRAGDDMYVRRGHLIGRGAFGSVYFGVNMANGQLVAVKQIRLADATDSIVRSIQREIDVMTRLPPHPNVVRYLGRKTSPRCISIIMEYVPGGSVSSLYTTVGRFHEATVRRYASMALQGLAHLHHEGIVHQDIKGGNVLVDGDGVAKIADFGCSKDLHLLTGSIKTAGTPLWMAPEVCSGQSATKMSDIWSFGCFILEMTNPDHLPWSGLTGGLFAVMYAIGNARSPPPIPESLSPAAQDFLRRCLAIDPTERATADELLQHDWIAGEHNDSFENFEDNLVPSATQTLLTDKSGVCSLKDLGSDTDDDDDDGDDGRVLRVPLAPMSPMSGIDVASPPRRTSSRDSLVQADLRTPATKPVVYRANGVADADATSGNMCCVLEELTPKDVTPSPSTSGRRKLGEKRTWFQKLFGS